jgi:hypothetical protein
VKSGFALCLAEGIDKGRESAARDNATEIASLKATSEAVHKNLCDILEQSNGVATGPNMAPNQGQLYNFLKLVSRFSSLEEKKENKFEL